MTVMTTPPANDVEAVARDAGLTVEQTRAFLSSVASWAMEGMTPTLEELRVSAQVTAGRIDVAEARRRLGG
jgi:hypothetical protein